MSALSTTSHHSDHPPLRTFRDIVGVFSPHPNPVVNWERLEFFEQAFAVRSNESYAQQLLETFFRFFQRGMRGHGTQPHDLRWVFQPVVDLADLRVKGDDGRPDVAFWNCPMQRSILRQMGRRGERGNSSAGYTTSGVRKADGAVIAYTTIDTRIHPLPATHAPLPAIPPIEDFTPYPRLGPRLAPHEVRYAVATLVMELKPWKRGSRSVVDCMTQVLGFLLGAWETCGTWLGLCVCKGLQFGRLAIVGEGHVLIEWDGEGIDPDEQLAVVGDFDDLLGRLQRHRAAAVPHSLLPLSIPPDTLNTEEADVAWRVSRIAYALALDLPVDEPLPRLPAPSGPHWEALRSFIGFSPPVLARPDVGDALTQRLGPTPTSPGAISTVSGQSTCISSSEGIRSGAARNGISDTRTEEGGAAPHIEGEWSGGQRAGSSGQADLGGQAQDGDAADVAGAWEDVQGSGSHKVDTMPPLLPTAPLRSDGSSELPPSPTSSSSSTNPNNVVASHRGHHGYIEPHLSPLPSLSSGGSDVDGLRAGSRELGTVAEWQLVDGQSSEHREEDSTEEASEVAATIRSKGIVFTTSTTDIFDGLFADLEAVHAISREAHRKAVAEREAAAETEEGRSRDKTAGERAVLYWDEESDSDDCAGSEATEVESSDEGESEYWLDSDEEEKAAALPAVQATLRKRGTIFTICRPDFFDKLLDDMDPEKAPSPPTHGGCPSSAGTGTSLTDK